MSPDERNYYRARAARERMRAADALPVAAKIHLELACLYEQLVDLDEGPKPPALRIVRDG